MCAECAHPHAGVFLKVWRPLKQNSSCGMVSFPSWGLVLQSGVMGMTDCDARDVIDYCQREMAQECSDPRPSIVETQRVGIGTRGSGSLLLGKRCSTLMETATPELEEA